ncbi:tRNA preQ1(34) S-adenosylmethionine ribosyltransferase-isomerase QueA [Candidatus Aerophobetes bacterium]|uniref:S-adenosylmethionine:tRNA ribosyltransferase-isomerase n=1 Tax=Aerophobetes bacterium TaxID=2030807 RepID=A0A662D074_UNCAE|nr:MAG: tRNA preQ1(34) S-adenosylmethionine ribosyltransferase-isomerase QueA [Candidatus Aerophobetes bacterium]
MKLEDFDYHLPRELIAQYPPPRRDSSRLLVLHRENGEIEHRNFRQITEFLEEGDVLVLNNTEVIPARLMGKKKDTGGKAEIFLLRRKQAHLWECLLRPAKKIKEDSQIYFPGTRLRADILKREEGARGLVKFTAPGKIEEFISRVGQIPLPPYIKRDTHPTLQDKRRYQTIYAKKKGAVAAPTAGLHFTPSLLQKIKEKGVKVVEITLHTGWASFKPLSKEKIEENSIPEEYFEINEKTALTINEAKRKGNKILAVGTTTTRALETQATSSGLITQGQGWTNLFIYPGYKFKIIEALLTNFHIPRSSLILLVSAFVGREKLLNAYREAIRQKYRFLSYGDAMLII